MKYIVYLLGFLWIAAGAIAILYTDDYKAYIKGLMTRLDRMVLALIPADLAGQPETAPAAFPVRCGVQVPDGIEQTGDHLLGGGDSFETADRDRSSGGEARGEAGELGLGRRRQTEPFGVLADRGLIEPELDEGRTDAGLVGGAVARPVVRQVVGVEAVDDDRQVGLFRRSPAD